MTGQRFLDLLAIGRVANLPTVWSNTLVGFLLAWTIDDREIPFEAGLQRLPLLLVGWFQETTLPTTMGDRGRLGGIQHTFIIKCILI